MSGLCAARLVGTRLFFISIKFIFFFNFLFLFFVWAVDPLTVVLGEITEMGLINGMDNDGQLATTWRSWEERDFPGVLS